MVDDLIQLNVNGLSHLGTANELEQTQMLHVEIRVHLRPSAVSPATGPLQNSRRGGRLTPTGMLLAPKQERVPRLGRRES